MLTAASTKPNVVVVGELYISEAQACQQAQMMSTGGFIGIAIGVVMLILGIVSIAKSMGRDHQVQTVAPVPRRVGPSDKNCRICLKDVKWWQSSVKQDNGLLHEECYWNQNTSKSKA